MSAESGIPTFRDAGGLWEGHRPEDVATPEAWQQDPSRVLRFYQMRKEAVEEASPNAGHLAIVALEQRHQVTVITQNIDDLHERAGSSDVLHLHGEIMKVRSCKDPSYLGNWGNRQIKVGDRCPKGGQLRPDVVWFGEAVPEFSRAIPIVQQAELILVVGTSMKVYPAAGLTSFAEPTAPIFVVNPDALAGVETSSETVHHIAESAAVALPKLVARLLADDS